MRQKDILASLVVFQVKFEHQEEEQAPPMRVSLANDLVRDFGDLLFDSFSF